MSEEGVVVVNERGTRRPKFESLLIFFLFVQIWYVFSVSDFATFNILKPFFIYTIIIGFFFNLKPICEIFCLRLFIYLIKTAASAQ